MKPALLTVLALAAASSCLVSLAGAVGVAVPTAVGRSLTGGRRRAPVDVVPLSSFATSANETGNDLLPLDRVKTISYTRVDPIVSPGAPAKHVHLVSGGNAFGPDTTYAVARRAACTTMPAKIDLSNYWSNPLYYVWPNGSLSALNGVTNITYLLRPPHGTAPNDTGAVREFPPDFQMLGGSPLRRNQSGALVDDWIWYVCEPTDGSASQLSYEIPDRECSVIKTVVNFPWCWNGFEMSTGGRNTHVAYGNGTGEDWVDCNSTTHPVRLPRIQYEVAFDVGAYPFRANSLVLSTGDHEGYSLHADFLSGWPVRYLDQVFDQRAACRAQLAGESGSDAGNSSACDADLDDIDRAAAASCTQPPQDAFIVNEAVGLQFPITQLPGCNDVSLDGDLLPNCKDPAFVDAEKAGLATAAGQFGPDSIPVSAAESSAGSADTDDGGGSNTGAIVGGVVGGVVGLALLAGALVWLCRRRRRKHRSLLSDENGDLNGGSQKGIASSVNGGTSPALSPVPRGSSNGGGAPTSSPPPDTVYSASTGVGHGPPSSAISREHSPGMTSVGSHATAVVPQTYSSPGIPTSAGSGSDASRLSPASAGTPPPRWSTQTGTYVGQDGRTLRHLSTVPAGPDGA